MESGSEWTRLKFPNIFESYLFHEDDCDELIKSSHVVEKDELYDGQAEQYSCLETFLICQPDQDYFF